MFESGLSPYRRRCGRSHEFQRCRHRKYLWSTVYLSVSCLLSFSLIAYLYQIYYFPAVSRLLSITTQLSNGVSSEDAYSKKPNSWSSDAFKSTSMYDDSWATDNAHVAVLGSSFSTSVETTTRTNHHSPGRERLDGLLQRRGLLESVCNGITRFCKSISPTQEDIDRYEKELLGQQNDASQNDQESVISSETEYQLEVEAAVRLLKEDLMEILPSMLDNRIEPFKFVDKLAEIREKDELVYDNLIAWLIEQDWSKFPGVLQIYFASKKQTGYFNNDFPLLKSESNVRPMLQTIIDLYRFHDYGNPREFQMMMNWARYQSWRGYQFLFQYYISLEIGRKEPQLGLRPLMNRENLCWTFLSELYALRIMDDMVATAIVAELFADDLLGYHILFQLWIAYNFEPTIHMDDQETFEAKKDRLRRIRRIIESIKDDLNASMMLLSSLSKLINLRAKFVDIVHKNLAYRSWTGYKKIVSLYFAFVRDERKMADRILQPLKDDVPATIAFLDELETYQQYDEVAAIPLIQGLRRRDWTGYPVLIEIYVSGDIRIREDPEEADKLIGEMEKLKELGTMGLYYEYLLWLESNSPRADLPYRDDGAGRMGYPLRLQEYIADSLGGLDTARDIEQQPDQQLLEDMETPRLNG